MKRQLLQGWLTHLGSGGMFVQWLLDFLGLIPEGYTAEQAAAFVVAFALAVYGRIRREFRKEEP